jgi:hypothetical protein
MKIDHVEAGQQNEHQLDLKGGIAEIFGGVADE